MNLSDLNNSLILALLNDPSVQGAIFTVLTTIVGSVVALIAKKYHTLLDGKVTSQQLEFLQNIADAAVKYAEQTGITASGEAKKATALAAVDTYLSKAGIKMTAEQIEAAVESAVFQNFTNPLPVITSSDGPIAAVVNTGATSSPVSAVAEPQSNVVDAPTDSAVGPNGNGTDQI